MEPGRVEVVAGVNLPMLIKLASVRDEGALDDVAGRAQDAGRKYINVASQLLAQRMNERRLAQRSPSSTGAACMPGPRPNS